MEVGGRRFDLSRSFAPDEVAPYPSDRSWVSPTNLHDVMPQNTAIIMFTAVRTSNLTEDHSCMNVTNDEILMNWHAKDGHGLSYHSIAVWSEEVSTFGIVCLITPSCMGGRCQKDDELAERRQSGSIVTNFPSECYGQVNLILRGPLRCSWTAPKSGPMRSAMTSPSASRGFDPVRSVILHPDSGSRDTENVVNILCVITATFSFAASLLIFSLCFSRISLFWKNKSRLMRSQGCLCVCESPPINFWMPVMD
jgi:hypothetical protein